MRDHSRATRKTDSQGQTWQGCSAKQMKADNRRRKMDTYTTSACSDGGQPHVMRVSSPSVPCERRRLQYSSVRSPNDSHSAWRLSSSVDDFFSHARLEYRNLYGA